MATTISNSASLDAGGLVVVPADLVQGRSLVVVDGVPKYKVETYLVSTGHLPDFGAFVTNIVDAVDASKDSFDHVAEVSDFFVYPGSREVAVSTGQTVYRSNSLLAYYTSLSAAVAGAAATKDAVDSLVKGWITYEYNFRQSPTVYELPAEEATVLASLIQAWQSSQIAEAAVFDESNAAQVALDAATQAVTAATAKASEMQTVYKLAQLLDDQRASLGAYVSRISSAQPTWGTPPYPFPDGPGGSGVWQAIADLVAAASAADPSVINTANIDATIGINTLTQFLTRANKAHSLAAAFAGATGGQASMRIVDNVFDSNTFNAASDAYRSSASVLTQISGIVSAAATAATLAQNAVDAAQLAYASKSKEYANAQTATASALQAIKDVYPAFNTTNPTSTG